MKRGPVSAMKKIVAAAKSSLAMPALNLAAASAFVACLWAVQAPAPAMAQSASCQTEFANLNKKLEGHVASLNALRGGKKKQLDAGAACPRLRNLAAAERQLLAYMKKEQSWCGIPDELIQKFTERSNNTARIAGQACKAAAMQKQMIRQQEQQAAGPAPDARPKLPTGPL